MTRDAVPVEVEIDEYLHTVYEAECEFVDGRLEERNAGEYEHSVVQTSVAAWFASRRSEWGIKTAIAYRTRVSSTRIRVPDVCVFPVGGPVEKVRVTPPLLAIEILSPEDRLPRVLTRLNDFLGMGVPNIWLIDPEQRSAFVYTRDGLRLVEETRLTIPNSPIYLDLAEIFSALDG